MRLKKEEYIEEGDVNRPYKGKKREQRKQRRFKRTENIKKKQREELRSGKKE